jgi:hypothetical protein
VKIVLATPAPRRKVAKREDDEKAILGLRAEREEASANLY